MIVYDVKNDKKDVLYRDNTNNGVFFYIEIGVCDEILKFIFGA